MLYRVNFQRWSTEPLPTEYSQQPVHSQHGNRTSLPPPDVQTKIGRDLWNWISGIGAAPKSRPHEVQMSASVNGVACTVVPQVICALQKLLLPCLCCMMHSHLSDFGWLPLMETLLC